MAHVRRQVRDRLIFKMKEIPEFKKVFNTSIFAIDKADLPAINIFTESDKLDENMGYIQVRNQTVSLSIHGEGGNVVDDLDELLVLVEKKLQEDPTLDGVLKSLFFFKIESSFEDADSARGEIELSINCLYEIDERDPEIFL
ncbi:MAG: hypothetical protein KC646_10245 [Candidatus Cloacimonetes bacterium]|nr:hypothetical protein [Candidatus Cloacimonadota bacterium]